MAEWICSRPNPHLKCRSAGNRTQDLMVSSQTCWPPRPTRQSESMIMTMKSQFIQYWHGQTSNIIMLQYIYIICGQCNVYIYEVPHWEVFSLSSLLDPNICLRTVLTPPIMEETTDHIAFKIQNYNRAIRINNQVPKPSKVQRHIRMKEHKFLPDPILFMAVKHRPGELKANIISHLLR